MFRFGRKKSSSLTNKVGASDSSLSTDLTDLGIPSLDMDEEDEHALADGDDEDSELLAQLHALSADGITSKQKPKAKPKPPPVAHEIDIEQLQRLGADEKECEVELTEEDMNDPVLLGELKAMGYVEEEGTDSDNMEHHVFVQKTSTNDEAKAAPEESHKTEKSIPIMTPQEAVSNVPQEGTKISTTQPYLSIDELVLSTDQEAIKKRIEKEKAHAMAQNRANDKASAIQSVRAYKRLESRLSELAQGDENLADESKDVPPPSISASTPSGSKSQPVSMDETAPLSPSPSPFPSPSRSIEKGSTSEDEKLKLLRAEEYKRAALHYKRNGNIAKAKEMMSQYQRILDAHGAQCGNQPSTSSSSLANFVLPPSPDLNDLPLTVSTTGTTPVIVPSPATSSKSASTPIQSTNSQRRRSSSKNPLAPSEGENDVLIKSDFGHSMEAYAKLETQLESQAAVCTSIAGHYLKCGDKTNALAFHKHRKNFLGDLESIRSYEASGLPVPRFHYAAFTYTIESAHVDLSASEMELAIVRAYGLGTKEVLGKNVEAYVVWDSGWPVDTSGATVGGSKGETKVAAKGMDPEFSFTKRIPIERNKAFQRHLERRKMQFEVFHYRGFLRGKVSLGKCQLRIDSLSTKCEVHEISQLTDSNRRPTGGKLELRVRLRTPLVKPDIVQKTEQWLVIDQLLSGAAAASSVQPSSSNRNTIPSPEVKSPASSSASTLTAPATPVKRGSSGTSPVSPVSPVKSVEESSATPAKGTTPPKRAPIESAAADAGPVNEELEQAEDWFNDVDNIPSNMVLEHELSLLATNKTRLSAEDAEDRKMQVDLKMNMLVMQVQTGALDIQKYLDNVRAATTKTKQYALLFKRHGRKDLAVRAMHRAKMMTEEVEEVERAQRGEGGAEG